MSDAVIPDLSKNLDWDPSVANPHHSDDADPVPTFHFDVDQDTACHVEADPDPGPTFHFDADQDPSFKIKAQKSKPRKKCSTRLIFHTLWLVIGKLIRIRIQLITLIR
jgi:hypothetical protein